MKRESFAVNSIDRCIYSFDNFIKDIKIMTDGRTVDDIVTEIADIGGIKLLPDKRPRVKKLFDRYFVLVKHIRK